MYRDDCFIDCFNFPITMQYTKRIIYYVEIAISVRGFRCGLHAREREVKIFNFENNSTRINKRCVCS